MRSLSILCFALLTASCGSSTSGSGGSGAGAGGAGAAGGTTSTSTGGTGTGGTTSTSTGGTGTGGEIAAFPVVINEIHAIGEDWVELMNTSDTPVDLTGYGLADSNSMGNPKIADAARFPATTALDAGGRMLIVAEQDPLAGVGPHDVCLSVGGPSVCFYATWGISAANGEKLFLVGLDDAVVAEAEYPPNAVVEPNTWGRLPDGTGNFAVNAATPGEANKAP